MASKLWQDGKADTASTEVAALDERFDAAAGFSTSTDFFSDGSGDYFGIAGNDPDDFGSDTTPSGLKSYEGEDGGYLTGQDLDGEGASPSISAEWNGIDITGLSSLTFQGSFAEYFDDPGDIDAEDYLRIEARIDGGAWQTLLAFAGADFSSDSYNGNFRQDTDLDGGGDGAALGNAFQEFSAAITGSGLVLDLRFTASVDAGDEDFAVDDFRIIGTSGGEATPAVIARAGDGLAVSETGMTTDSFTLELATVPAAPVEITITAPDGQSEISLDGISFGASVTAVLNGADPVGIMLRAVNDELDEDTTHTGMLGFEVVSSDPDYDGITLSDLTVAITDDDAAVTLISAVQGGGDHSDMTGQEVTVEAVVTGIITDGSGRQVGYYLQEEDADQDGDAATSEGLYVYSGGSVSVGDKLRLTGNVSEYGELTQLEDIRDLQVLETGAALPSVTQITLGMRDGFEAYEGMRVQLLTGSEEPLTVVTNFDLDRYGEIQVAEGNLIQPTQIYDAQTQAAEIDALAARNAAARLTIDDGSTGQNPDRVTMIDSGDGTPLEAGDPLTAEGPTLRLGTQLSGITGIMDERYGGYRVQVDAPLEVIEGTGERPDNAPDVGGDLQVASFNVLNYFTTLGASGRGTGPDGDLDPRGATTAEDLARQTDKLVAAITGMDAEIIALQEIENNGFGEGSAIAALVDALNGATAPGTYAFVDPGMDFVGTDAITTGIIYRADQVTLTGSAVLEYTEHTSAATTAIAERIEETTGEQLDDYDRNRPSIAATFETEGGAEITAVANHFKSKGDSGLQGLMDAAEAAGADPALIEALRDDPNFDQGNGQGFWNGVRTEAAAELSEWLLGNPTGAESLENLLILGDLNSYAAEDPVQMLEENGLTDLAGSRLGTDAYSYVFDGQRGTLDYGMASEGLLDKVTEVAEWHINADEPDLFSYSSEYNNPSFYREDPYAVSDHDPLLIGLTLDPERQLVSTRAEFDDSRLLFNRVTYSEDGEKVSTDTVPVLSSELKIAGSDITVSAEGRGHFNLLNFAGDGLSVYSPFMDRPFGSDAKRLDKHEAVRFSMEDGGRLTDALDVTLELDSVSGSGNLHLSFFDDDVLVDEILLKPADESIYADPGMVFDEMVVSADQNLAFEIAAVDFTRIEDDGFTFV
ncbi:ExeM/NucH family extracellular endonuclease [Paracoccus onubensis]|uniref:ExeM/NucH family extracellular endonuclease n=1 Tax=Paracoccus onubensis TaxID=1675788 RepID=A0A418SN68_9RHOB|nr:ExeM/NucH family extracellular endonuclease [Paracoccus onubensis]RJE82385.1 ExeM/NucH family extracellular endonuclease [Paracoccus onubensis]